MGEGGELRERFSICPTLFNLNAFVPLCREHSALAVVAHSFDCIANHVCCKLSALMFEKVH